MQLVVAVVALARAFLVPVPVRAHAQGAAQPVALKRAFTNAKNVRNRQFSHLNLRIQNVTIILFQILQYCFYPIAIVFCFLDIGGQLWVLFQHIQHLQYLISCVGFQILKDHYECHITALR